MKKNWPLLSLAAAALLGSVAGLSAAAAPTTFILTQTGTSSLNDIPSMLSHASRGLDGDQHTSRSYTLTYDQLNAEDAPSGDYGLRVEGRIAGGGRLPYVIGSKGKDGYKNSDFNQDGAGRGSIIGYDRRHDGKYHLSSDNDYERGYRRNYGLGSSMYGGLGSSMYGGLGGSMYGGLGGSMYGGLGGSIRDMMFMNHGSGYHHMKGIGMNQMMNFPLGESMGGHRLGGFGSHHMGNHMGTLMGGGYPMPHRRPYMGMGLGTGHGYPGMGMFGHGGMMFGHRGMNYGLRGGAHGYSLGSSFGGGYGNYGGFLMEKRSSSNEIGGET